MAVYKRLYWHLFFWLLAGVQWQAMADTRQCVTHHLTGKDPSFVEKGKGQGAEGREPEMVEHYRGNIWFGLIDADYVIQSSSTLALALEAKAEYIYTPSFMLKLFSGNPWLKYCVLDFVGKQKLLQAIRKRIYRRRWFSTRTPTQEITRLLSDQFFSKLSSRRLQLSSSTSDRFHRKELLQLLEAADVAGSITRLVKGNNTESVFSWVESIRRNPFSTVMQAIAHSFDNAIGGYKGMNQRSLNQTCFAVAHKSSHILPLTPLLPGGILGKIMQTMSRSYITRFHPFLLPFKGIVSIVLAILCRLGVPRIVHQFFSRVARAKRRLGRVASGLWYKYVGLRGDPVGRNMLADVFSRSGIVMITLLFQLHAVDVERVKGGAKVEGALLAGGGAWALSDGLFVGLKDFGQMFKQLMSTYVYFARRTLDYCSAKVTFGRNEVKALDAFLNGVGKSQQPPATRLYTWCHKNYPYVKRLANNMYKVVYNFGKQVVKVLRMEFTAFTEYFANVMSIFYELSFSTLESEIRSALSGHYDRPEYGRELEILLARQEALRRPKSSSAMPRAIFRKPWMEAAIRKLANGYFVAAGALAVLDLQKTGKLSPGEDDPLTASFRAYNDLATASSLIRSAVGIIFGHFLHSQALITTAKGQKSRMKVYDFIVQCQDSTASGHAEVCGETVTKSIDEVKFVSKSLLALNAGVAMDTHDLVLTHAFTNERGLDITSVFADWREWLLNRRRGSRGKAANFIAYADNVSSKEKVHGFIDLLRTSLENRLRFYRFDVESSGVLRLFDLNGRSALFKPRSTSVLKEFLRHLKPDPLDAPTAFIAHNLNEGQLLFAQAPALPLDGYLTYENERRELQTIQRDALAVKDLLVAHLTRHLGRLRAEMMAMVILMLHRKIPQFRDNSVTEFIRSMSPKMLFDGVLILLDYQRESRSPALERDLYSLPLSLSSLMSITATGLNETIPRLASEDTSNVLSIYTTGVLHAAYQMVQKNRTGRTKVLEHFQKSLLYVVDEFDAGRLTATFPECAFLLSPDGTVAFKTALKCALYRFQKLGSYNIRQDGEENISTEQIIAYLEAVVEYLDRVRSRTPWRTFLNLKAFRSSADAYRNRAAKYTYEELQRHITAHASESADPLTTIRGILSPTEKGQGRREVFTSIHAGLSKMARMASQRVRAVLSTLLGKLVRTLGAESIPKPLRLLNALSGAQFFGALEYAEFKVFPDTQELPKDFIQTADLSFFGHLLIYLGPVEIYLEDATAMYNIVSEMRTMPLVTPEATELVEDIRKKVQTMSPEDVRVAAGYIASHGDDIRLLTAKTALALLSLAEGNTSVQATGALSVLNPTFLGFILKVLDFPDIFKQIKAISEEKASKILRFRPRGSLVAAFPFRKTILPLGERFRVEEGLRRLVETGLLKKFAAVEGQHEGEGNTELTCLTFYEHLRVQHKTDSQGALRTGSYKANAGGRRAGAACALFFLMKEMQKSGRTETTVEDVLRQQYHKGSSIISILKRIGSATTKFPTRLRLMKDINPVLSVVYKMATKGGLDASLKSYSLKTKHLSFISRETAAVTDLPLYDLFSKVIDFLEKKSSAVSVSFRIQLSSYYAAEWIRFLETDRLRTYAQNDERGTFERLSPETFKHVSSVYAYYDLIDYYISLRQRSVVPVDIILRNASRSLMERPSRVLAAYGLAMTNLDLGEEIKKAKLFCYDKALTDYTNYLQRDRQSQEMWKIDCVHDQLSHRGSLSYSVASLTPDEVSLLIDTIENELRKEVEARYTILLQENIDLELFKRRVWSFIILPHVSLRSAPRLRANVFLAKVLVGGLRRQLPWSAIVDNVADTRRNKALSREPSETGPRVYSSTERPYLYNPFQVILDILTFFMTSKPISQSVVPEPTQAIKTAKQSPASVNKFVLFPQMSLRCSDKTQRLRLPRVLLRKRTQILARLPLLRRRTFSREVIYDEELVRSEQALKQS